MKKILKMTGIIVLVAIIGLSMAACGDGDDGDGGNGGNGGNSGDTGGNGNGGTGGGTLTITDIPATYNDQYVRFLGTLMSQQQNIIGAKSVTRDGLDVTIKAVQIKNGRVSLPMWVLSGSGSVSRYSGNDTFTEYQSIGIYSSEIVPLDSGQSGAILVKKINFPSVTFSNGSTTLSCNDAANF